MPQAPHLIVLILNGALLFGAAALPGYLLGSIPWGLLLSRLGGVDIRSAGSGNIGATNVWRVMGWRWGLPTFLLDTAKGIGAVLLTRHLATLVLEPSKVMADAIAWSGTIAGLAAILGHSFPVWLRFKGGKGVATSLGVIGALMPLQSLVVFGVWGLVFAASRYVSLASIVAALCLPILALIAQWDDLKGNGGRFPFACLAALLVVRRHRENITRLLNGTENRFGKTKPSDTLPQP
jgi:glycerol-3-phosphate acyltransferase PlsY